MLEKAKNAFLWLKISRCPGASMPPAFTRLASRDPIPLFWGIALGREPRLNIKYSFNWAGKIEHLQRSQCGGCKS